ncbi:MAG: MXAN_5187 C-terminal domain-containing protein [Myxococcota bacterium]|nr:MXAN_5187 C-terminal domain-containing protein [Myxococcota bacterium]
MRLKLIGIYLVLVVALGVSVRTCIDWKLAANQEAALDSAAREASAHVRAALDARGLRLVALANLAAANPKVSAILDQWRKVAAEETRLRILGRFLQLRGGIDQREVFERLVKDDPRLKLGSTEAAPAGGTPSVVPPPAAPPVAGSSSPSAAVGVESAVRADALPNKAAIHAGEAAKAAAPDHSDKDGVPGKPERSAKPVPPEEAAPPAAAPPAPSATGSSPPAEAPPSADPAAAAAAAPPDAGVPDLAAKAIAYRNGAQICRLVGCSDEERSDFLAIFSAGIPICEGDTCSDNEVAGLFALLNVATMLTADQFGFTACREAYLPGLEAVVRQTIERQVEQVRARRAGETPARRRPGDGDGDAPVEVAFDPKMEEFALGRFEACTVFAAKGIVGLADEINGRLFTLLGHEAAAASMSEITGKTAFKVEFVWLLDAVTGRGIAKDREFRRDTADRHYYQTTIDGIFEGIAPPVAERIVSQVRGGMFYRDLWYPLRKIEDQTTGFVDVAVVPSRNAEGRTGGLVAVAVKVENLAPVAREARAKVLLFRKAPAAAGQAEVQIVGAGNDNPSEKEGLAEDFRKALLDAVAGDVRSVAGNDAAKDKGLAPPSDFEFGESSYRAMTAGLINSAGQIARDDAGFAVGPLAVTVLVDKRSVVEAMSTVGWTWVFTGAAAILAIVFALLLAHHFIKPITQIEDGLLRIMNGDWTHRFDVRSAEVGGLSYRINQLMASLLGDEEEAEPGSDAAGDAGMGADPAEAKYRDLYVRFQAAQRQSGQDPAGTSYEDFRARIVDNEQKILQKNPGRHVDFDIVVSGGQITFKPIVR